MYLNGQGVPQDYAEAYFWQDIAASEPERIKALITGNSAIDSERLRIFNAWLTSNTPFFREVDKSRDDAASHLTPAEQSQVQERVRKWIEEHPIH